MLDVLPSVGHRRSIGAVKVYDTISSPVAVSAMSPLTSLATTPVAVAVRLMRAPLAMKATG
jgi:hypothetical protein